MTAWPTPTAGGVTWDTFGCAGCGHVWTLPAVQTEAAPWCVHHGGNYSWRPPSPATQDGAWPWQQLIRVDVRPREH